MARLRNDTMRTVYAMLRMYPVSAVSIERNKFDPQPLLNPDIRGREYRRGTLYGWQLRAYILDRGRSRGPPEGTG